MESVRRLVPIPPFTVPQSPAARARTWSHSWDAAVSIRDLELFRQARPVWDRAAEMILIAAETGKRDDIAEARRHILVALGRENW